MIIGIPVFILDTLELAGIMGFDALASYIGRWGTQPYHNMEWINENMYVNSMEFMKENFQDEKMYESSNSNVLPNTIHMIIALIIFILFY